MPTTPRPLTKKGKPIERRRSPPNGLYRVKKTVTRLHPAPLKAETVDRLITFGFPLSAKRAKRRADTLDNPKLIHSRPKTNNPPTTESPEQIFEDGRALPHNYKNKTKTKKTKPQ